MTTGRDWLEDAVNRSWYGRIGVTYLLLPLQPIAALVIWWRRRFRPRAKFAALGAPIIVVGGLTAGGTGKTPTLIALVRYLSGKGLKVGVVSRGYGREAGKSGLLVEVEHSAEKVGDEPLLIKRSVPTASVMVGDSRLAAARSLFREQGVSVILSDDGLQHYALPRDFEIAVLDANRRFGNGWLLPVGPLREPIKRLQSVDFVLERNGSDPASAFHYVPTRLVTVDGKERLSVSDASNQWAGKKVVAATGLGQPSQFFSLLSDLGLECETVNVADHAVLDLWAIETHFQPDIVVVTAKDAVKLEVESCHNVWVLEVEAELPDSLYLAIEQSLKQVSI
ncbi:lipid-A-disaccharide kinase [gamma proteobacterium HIMB55]|nr:lipid-A-disaccharide kinase [gamma proteobacterium HIMB55]